MNKWMAFTLIFFFISRRHKNFIYTYDTIIPFRILMNT